MKFHDIEGGFAEDKKVMLFKEIAAIHDKEVGRINESINRNRKRFTENIDIIDLKKAEFAIDLCESGIYTKNSMNASSNIYLLSERGYAKLLKILEDDMNNKKFVKILTNEETTSLNIYCGGSKGFSVIKAEGLIKYSKSNYRYIDWEKFLKELKVNDCRQVKDIKEIENKKIEISNNNSSSNLSKMFEGHQVEIIEVNGEILFELYSTGMALGYENKRSNSAGKEYISPYKSRIDKVLKVLV